MADKDVFSQGAITKKQIFFDLDDTLIDDNYKFEILYCDCLRAIVLAFETRSPQLDEILQHARQIDDEHVESFAPDQRFLPARHIQTWIRCYRELCEKYQRTPKPHVEKLLESLITQGYEPPYYVIPDAIDTLNQLLHYGRYDLHIISAGGPDIQQRKLDTTNLSKYFGSVHNIPDGNKRGVLHQAVEQFGPQNICMVGNSIHSDVNPSLKLGLKTVYIPRGSWHYFKVEPINNNFTTLDTIAKLPEELERNWK